ncbi:MAG: hypothetical protein KHX05_03895 [Firmicutes bacterium]|nr:hypothetical protein [Bacillota bacterium]
MAKYKCGDKVRIVSKRTQQCWNPYMDKYLGKTMTIIKSGINNEGVYYCMEEDLDDFLGHWCWYEDMIAGLAEPEREPCTVELRFDGMITTATLKRGGRDVKTAEARCNPEDTYSRAEGARVAVERLFEKKRKEDKPEKYTPKVGDKFKIVGKSHYHGFSIGETVRLIRICEQGKRYENCRGLGQWVCDSDVKPYKENAK